MSDEQTVAIVSFVGAVKREVKRVRERLKKAVENNQVKNDFGFEIKATGRVLNGEVKLLFKLGEYEFMADSVSGNTVDAVVDEFLRRKGWTQLNAPIAISFDKKIAEVDDEIPF